jgi:hypothetical protein
MEILLNQEGDSVETSSIVDVEAEKVLKDSLGNEYGRADIIIEYLFNNTQKGILFIEAKVDASEGESQLERYEAYLMSRKDSFNKISRVFLTPEARGTETNLDDWINITFIDILSCIEKSMCHVENKTERSYLALFGASILKDILGIQYPCHDDQYKKYQLLGYLLNKEEEL